MKKNEMFDYDNYNADEAYYEEADCCKSYEASYDESNIKEKKARRKGESAIDIETKEQILKEIGKYELLSEEEELALLKKKDESKSARDKLILHNLRLVLNIAIKHKGKGEMALEDLYQEGCIGLQKAVENFDYRTGNKLSTYAYTSVEGSIKRAIANNSGMITVSHDMQSKIRKMYKAREVLKNELGREASDAELAAKLGWKPAMLNKVAAYSATSITSLDETGEDGKNIHETTPDKSVITEDEICFGVSGIMEQMLRGLTENERKTFLYRNYAYKDERLSLEEVGKILGVSKQAVEGYEKKALRRLRTQAIAMGYGF